MRVDCPLEVLLVMFKAVGQNENVNISQIRKYLRILINRSLVLGTVDRPSVHDLVLDFVRSQHTGDEMRKNHRRVVEAFRASRPQDGHGRHRYDRMRRDDLKSTYVCNEICHHIAHGWEREPESGKVVVTDVLAVREWLGDVPQDEIVLHAGAYGFIPYGVLLHIMDGERVSFMQATCLVWSSYLP